MKVRSIALALSLVASTAFAVVPKASPCLSSQDSKNCLASVAAAVLASEKSPGSRTEGYASLITSLAKADVRRDDIFFAAMDDVSAPIQARWILAVARRTYALHFGISDPVIDTPQRIEVLADLLRKQRGDGFERLTVAWTACEAREGASPVAIAKWEGVLDRLCKLDDIDENALKNEVSVILFMAAPMVDAYNRDSKALDRSIAASLIVLAEYEKMLSLKMTVQEREAIQSLLALGRMINATALAISGQRTEAGKAVGVLLEQIRKTPKFSNPPGSQIVLAQVPWIYAKLGMHNKVIGGVRESLARVDGGRTVSNEDKALAIGMVIEALRLLELDPTR
jgi:hypothetical protein